MYLYLVYIFRDRWGRSSTELTNFRNQIYKNGSTFFQQNFYKLVIKQTSKTMKEKDIKKLSPFNY